VIVVASPSESWRLQAPRAVSFLRLYAFYGFASRTLRIPSPHDDEPHGKPEHPAGPYPGPPPENTNVQKPRDVAS
jgi:hypothetical protein